ncbi:MAG: ECF transporter S component [Lachnospiraceae bacterium]
MNKHLSTQKLCFIGLFGALSTILMLFQVPLFFAPSFLKLDLSELPAILGGFMFGPLSGFMIVVVKLLLNLLIDGSDTMYVGELSNLVLSSTYVLTSSIIYVKHKTKKQAIIGLTSGVLLTSFLAVISNLFVVYPMYAQLYGIGMDGLLKLSHAVNPFVTDNLTMMLFSVLPFNLVKYTVVSLITFLLYKKLHVAIMKYIA